MTNTKTIAIQWKEGRAFAIRSTGQKTRVTYYDDACYKRTVIRTIWADVYAPETFQFVYIAGVWREIYTGENGRVWGILTLEEADTEELGRMAREYVLQGMPEYDAWEVSYGPTDGINHLHFCADMAVCVMAALQGVEPEAFVREIAESDNRKEENKMMNFADYIDQVRDDALQAVESGDYDTYDDADDVIDAMWIDDSITGNASGSYTFNAARAAENTAGLIWDDEFLEELQGMCIDLASLLKEGPEALDVTTRCLALGYVHDDVREAWEARAC